MHTLILKQKPSNFGTIHDIESQHFDLEINFRKGCKFAVVLASHYEDYRYTTHKTIEAASKKSAALSIEGFIHQIIDQNGNYVQTQR